MPGSDIAGGAGAGTRRLARGGAGSGTGGGLMGERSPVREEEVRVLVSAYEYVSRISPGTSPPILLRPPYVMSGTGGMSGTDLSSYVYAVSGTDLSTFATQVPVLTSQVFATQ
eukprot:2153098-Rhodomonas_salina.3